MDIYTHKHTHICTYIYTHIYTYTNTHTYTHTYIWFFKTGFLCVTCLCRPGWPWTRGPPSSASRVLELKAWIKSLCHLCLPDSVLCYSLISDQRTARQSKSVSSIELEGYSLETHYGNMGVLSLMFSLALLQVHVCGGQGRCVDVCVGAHKLCVAQLAWVDDGSLIFIIGNRAGGTAGTEVT